MLKKIEIRNYRRFASLSMDFHPELNTIVGNNDAGKSTILEAINLCLTGRIGRDPLAQHLTPHHFNRAATTAFFAAHQAGEDAMPPEFTIDLYLDTADDPMALLKGDNNVTGEDAHGLRLRCSVNPDMADEFAAFMADADDLDAIPVEYYRVDWMGFSGNGVTWRAVPASCFLVDPTSIRLGSGTDYFVRELIKQHISDKDRSELKRAYRIVREDFAANDHVKRINKDLAKSESPITDKPVSIGIDVTEQAMWENTLVPHLDELPLRFSGRGEQHAVKILLALRRQAERYRVALIEEPETHLSHTSLARLTDRIVQECEGKQVFLTTHSSFVLNKLGLDSLLILGPADCTRLTDLSKETCDFFRKLPGFDTLRMVLAERTILVEGPSDELIVQRAYKDQHGKWPIEAGVEVLSVGLSFRRFVELAIKLGCPVTIVRDNDGKDADVLRQSYELEGHDTVLTVCIDADVNLRTLEPHLIAAAGRESLNDILGTTYGSDKELLTHMTDDKTGAALAIFQAAQTITMPPYVIDAVA